MKKLILLFFLLATITRSQNTFKTYYGEALQHLEKEEYTPAIEKFTRALNYKKEEQNAYKVSDAYIYRSYCRFKLKNLSGALEDVDEGLKIKPESIKGYTLKSFFYLESKQYEKCIEVCNKGLSINPHSEELLLGKAEASNLLKKYSESRSVLHTVLEEDPKSTKAMREIANTFQKEKKWDSSLVYFSMAIEINPLDFVSYYNRGISKSEMKDYDGAKEDIEKGMRMDSLAKYVGYNNLGFFLKLEQGDLNGAIEYFDKAIQLNPDFAYAYSNRGFAKLSLGDIKGAHKDLKKSIDLDNTNSYAFKNLGLIYLKENKKEDACKNFKKALELGYEETYDDEVNRLIRENCK